MASTSYTHVGNYTAAWASVYDLYFPPEIWNEWYERYGKGFKILDWMNTVGRTGKIADRTFYHFEDGTDQRVITVGATTIPVGAAGGISTFNLDAADYDTNGNGPLRTNFTILIPPAYLTDTDTGVAPTRPRLFVVTGKTGDDAAATYDVYPIDDAIQITLAVPAGTELMIGPSMYAPGTGQPDGMTTGTYKRTHKTQIVKESAGFEGGQVGKRNYREFVDNAGNPRIFDRETIAMEFRFDRQIDSALFIGEPNENTGTLTQTSHFGGTPVRQGTKGLWAWQDELAQAKNYVGNFDMDDFDDIKPLLQSQGVVDMQTLFLYGSDLGLDVENSVLDGLREWSGGTDLTKGEKFEVNFKSVKKNGIVFHCKEAVSFANPNSFGNSSYDFSEYGMIIPIGDVSVTNMKGEKKSVPNLSVAYYNNKGEDRTRIMGTVAGLNGMGYQITNEYDGSKVYMLSEFALFAANVNQHVQVKSA